MYKLICRSYNLVLTEGETNIGFSSYFSLVEVFMKKFPQY